MNDQTDKKEMVSKLASQILEGLNIEKKAKDDNSTKVEKEAAVFESKAHSKIGPLVMKGESNFLKRKSDQPLAKAEIGGTKKRVGFQIGGKDKQFTRGEKDKRIGKAKTEKAAAFFEAILAEKQASEEEVEKTAMEKMAAVEKAAETYHDAQLIKQAAEEYFNQADELEKEALEILDALGYEVVAEESNEDEPKE